MNLETSNVESYKKHVIEFTQSWEIDKNIRSWSASHYLNDKYKTNSEKTE